MELNGLETFLEYSFREDQLNLGQYENEDKFLQTFFVVSILLLTAFFKHQLLIL
jgi:hypothetical protein